MFLCRPMAQAVVARGGPGTDCCCDTGSIFNHSHTHPRRCSATPQSSELAVSNRELTASEVDDVLEEANVETEGNSAAREASTPAGLTQRITHTHMHRGGHKRTTQHTHGRETRTLYSYTVCTPSYTTAADGLSAA